MSGTFFYEKRCSTAFQLMTSQMALKYSALRFWYWRLNVTLTLLDGVNWLNGSVTY